MDSRNQDRKLTVNYIKHIHRGHIKTQGTQIKILQGCQVKHNYTKGMITQKLANFRQVGENKTQQNERNIYKYYYQVINIQSFVSFQRETQA